jgi:hydrogenase maturation protein HypF
LPGGERAARQPWRTALALCWECGHDWPPAAALGNPALRAAWEGGINAPLTTSVGRLFDAAAAVLGVCKEATYEGHAPMLLESLCNDASAAGGPGRIPLPLARDAEGIWRTDWAPLLPMLADGQRAAVDRAALFHASLAHALCEQALAVREETAVARVGLSGGVFQNRVLTEHAQTLLLAEGFEVLIPQQLPPNDAAISFGQLVEAIAIRQAPA